MIMHPMINHIHLNYIYNHWKEKYLCIIMQMSVWKLWLNIQNKNKLFFFTAKQTAKNMLILNYMKCSVKLLRKQKKEIDI